VQAPCVSCDARGSAPRLGERRIVTYSEKQSNDIRNKLRHVMRIINKFFKTDDGQYQNEEDEYLYIDGIMDDVKKIINS
jgi:hypothetical protein